LSANPNIAAMLVDRAARHPDRPAIVEGRGRRWRGLTFATLADRVALVGGGLRDRGFHPGDRALLFVPMSGDLYVALLAVLHAGGAAVFLDAWAGRDRLEAAVAASAPHAFIGTPRAHLLRLLSPSLRRIPIRLVAGRGPLALERARLGAVARGRARGSPESRESPGSPGRPGLATPAVVQADDHALITFTTGSTGRPKAAARSHAFLQAQHRVLARHLALGEHDVDMPTLPVFVLNNLALGVTSVLPDFDPRRPADIDAGAVLRQIRDEGVTTTSGSPAFYERLAAHATAQGERIPVRALFTGGAPVFPPLARALEATVAGDVHVLYGSTEAEPIAGIDALELARLSEGPDALGVCAGRPVPEIELRLIRPVDGPVRADELAGLMPAPGEPGEIIVAGEHVLAGYLDDPQAEALSKIRDGDRVWHRTGDGGHLDEEGRLWLLGRVGQRVERDDGTWWPMAAEARALTVPGVRHAAYLGVRNPQAAGQGRDVEAVLCLEVEAPAGGAPAERPDGMETRVRAALAGIPVDRVVMVGRIPRDPRHASKTDIVRLRELLDHGASRG
jgi:olefin beta-lactone synthetase